MSNPFANWSERDVALFNAKGKGQPTPPSSGVEKESELHAEILAYCKSKGWIAFHGSMAHSTFRTEGEPDFVILTDGGRVLMVEAKTAKGKLSPAQQAIHAWASKLGHKIEVCRSLKDFIVLILNQP